MIPARRAAGVAVAALALGTWLGPGGTAVAQSYSMPTTDADVVHFYPTAYKDHGGRDWACGGIYYSGHNGTDLGVGGFPGMDAGRTVVAAAAGQVVTAVDGFFDRCTSGACPGGGGYGNYVSIDHGGGNTSYYGHLKQWSVSVSSGDTVACGQALGQVGSSGWSTGPHLHFEPRSFGVAVDPFSGTCATGASLWYAQGAHGGLPAVSCESSGSSAPPIPAPFIVDDQDPGFAFVDCSSVGDVLVDAAAGWDGRFYYLSPFAVDVPLVTGEWVPDIPETGLYQLDAYVPLSWNAMATLAPFDVAFQGGHAIYLFDQSVWGDVWDPIFPDQPFKFVAGQRNRVKLFNLTNEAFDAYVAWDAIQWTYVGPAGPGQPGDSCSLSNDCEGALICMGQVCAEDCSVAGCASGSCEIETGVCIGGGGGGGDDDDGNSGPYWNPPPDQDTDGDGIPDYIEGTDDSDGDGLVDWLDDDSDGDGIPDGVEGVGDYDHDGIPNFRDLDSDGDGLSDANEAGPDPENPVDTDGDGQMDFLDNDSDGDSLPDEGEVGDPDNPTDTDGDGTSDHLDEDSDGDGLSDEEEAGDDPSNPVDSDGDGTPDYQDDDSDGDGLSDAFEGNDDSDGDGTPDYLDLDSDNDGIPDSEDPDSDGDGIPDVLVDEADEPDWVDSAGCCGLNLAGAWLPGPFACLVLLVGAGFRRRRRAG